MKTRAVLATSPGADSRNVLSRLDVSDVMTAEVISCSPSTALRDIARLMAARRVHAIFVFDYGIEDDEDTELWGVVSDLDLVAAAVGAIEDRTAGDMAVTPLVTVTSDAVLKDAAELMAQTGSSHLAVLDPSTRRPVGVISTLDIARAVTAATPASSRSWKSNSS